jgi:uncharacterized protein (DUF305 family)
MAEIAKERSRRSEIMQLADEITNAQNAEIAKLTAVERRLKDAGVDAGDLGVAEHEMGMGDDASMLEDAKPLDREFINMTEAIVGGVPSVDDHGGGHGM